eukprot:m.22156 g.22156  ORF g.22156 m.22156 type:complete len:372 (+) comp8811_c0_seq3:94-1209(+)
MSLLFVRNAFRRAPAAACCCVPRRFGSLLSTELFDVDERSAVSVKTKHCEEVDNVELVSSPVLFATKRFPLSQFGTLQLHLDCASVVVTSLNPGYHPASAPEDLDDRTEGFLEIIQVDPEGEAIEEENVIVNVWEPEEQVEVNIKGKNILCKAWIPFSCDVDARGVAQFTLKSMEGGSFQYCGQGDCFISNSKLRSFTVMTEGNITCDKVQGNVTFDSMNGGIFAGKIQSEEAILRTHGSNPIEVETLLSGSSLLSSDDGNVTVGHFHGDISVDTENGNIEIGSGDGSLSAVSDGNGHIRTHVAATTTVNTLQSKRDEIEFTVDESDIPAPTTVEGQVALKKPFTDAWAFKGSVVKRIRDHRPSFPTIDVC